MANAPFFQLNYLMRDLIIRSLVNSLNFIHKGTEEKLENIDFISKNEILYRHVHMEKKVNI